MSKRKQIIVLLVLSLSVIGIVVFLDLVYWSKWQQNIYFFNGNMQRGSEMQLTVDEFERQIGRHPLYNEFTNVFGCIGSFQECITLTNRVTSAFDNLGGWFYDEKSGEVGINRNEKYVIGFQLQVDLSKIHFRPPTKVETIHFGKTELLDYTSFDERIDAERPQIGEIIKNWAITNGLSPVAK